VLVHDVFLCIKIEHCLNIRRRQRVEGNIYERKYIRALVFFVQPFYHLQTGKNLKKRDSLRLSVSWTRIRSDLADLLLIKFVQLLQFTKCIGVKVNNDYILLHFFFGLNCTPFLLNHYELVGFGRAHPSIENIK
jgi:hypothetical protein